MLCCETGQYVAFKGTSDSQYTLLGEETIKRAVEYNVDRVLLFAYFLKMQMLSHEVLWFT